MGLALTKGCEGFGRFEVWAKENLSDPWNLREDTACGSRVKTAYPRTNWIGSRR